MNMDVPNFEGLIEACFDHPDDDKTIERFFYLFRPKEMATLISMYPTDPTLAQEAIDSAFSQYRAIFRSGPNHENLSSYVAYFDALAKDCLISEIRRHNGDVRID